MTILVTEIVVKDGLMSGEATAQLWAAKLKQSRLCNRLSQLTLMDDYRSGNCRYTLADNSADFRKRINIHAY
jgi:hypothetical protein